MLLCWKGESREGFSSLYVQHAQVLRELKRKGLPSVQGTGMGGGGVKSDACVIDDDSSSESGKVVW